MDKLLVREIVKNNSFDNFVLGKKENKRVMCPVKNKINYSYESIVERAMTNSFTVVQGPPGSGKSSFIVELASRLLDLGEDVIICAMNNQALTALCDKLDHRKIVYNCFRAKTYKGRKGNYQRLQQQKLKLGTPAQLINQIDVNIPTLLWMRLD